MRAGGRIATAALTAALVAPAHAGADAGTAATGAQNHAHSRQRGADQLANPDYQRRAAPHVAKYFEDPAYADVRVDPYRLDWGETRGRQRAVAFTNRYGARLTGFLFAPADGDGASRARRGRFRRPTGPFPTVVLMTGGDGPSQGYWGMAQGLAEAGYLVFAVHAMGDLFSDAEGDAACEPDDWRHEQELGIVDPDPCGRGGDGAGGGPPEPVDMAGWLVELKTQGVDYDAVAADYHATRARKALSAIDATNWLLSDDNPWGALVDAQRLGLVGHSLGAHAALLVGNGDDRFDAAVVWDGYGRLPTEDVAPRVPTMFQHADQEEAMGPRTSRPDPDELPGHRDARLFEQNGVDTMVVALGGSTHQEWNYIPFQAVNPLVAPFADASRHGERVALYYTRAWLDRYLKDDGAAAQRLLAATFDGSVDGSSIGQGTYDPVAGNVPYTIAEESVADHLSPFFSSWSAARRARCANLRASC